MTALLENQIRDLKLEYLSAQNELAELEKEQKKFKKTLLRIGAVINSLGEEPKKDVGDKCGLWSHSEEMRSSLERRLAVLNVMREKAAPEKPNRIKKEEIYEFLTGRYTRELIDETLSTLLNQGECFESGPWIVRI